MNNIFIGLSWPYANGELHIGHLGSSLPADILARYFRLKGENVCFVSGSDCFGTPISIQAQKENTKPDIIANFYHEKFVEIFKQLDFSFDNYTKTSNEYHINFAKDFHDDLYKSSYVYKKEEQRLFCQSCKRFLPDRYVLGLCPKCGNITKGDACEKCGKILEPEELFNPKCGICNSTPILKNTFQYYLALSKLEDQLKKFYQNNNENWSTNAKKLTERYFSEGLIDRAISRDLDWGVPIPSSDSKEKVIYNWGENVLGYVDACKEYCEKNNFNFNDWFKSNDCKHYYIHAKDNIQFHTIIYPALLLANSKQYHLPDNIYAYEFVNNEGQKISKSKGTCLTARELLEKFDVDFLRFYFAKNISDKKDLDFRLEEFANTVNGELINNWGNFVNRTLSFVKNKFNGKIKKSVLDDNIKTRIEETFTNTSNFIEQGKIANALRTILELVDFSNKYFNETEPWNAFKINEEKCKNLCYQYLSLILNLAILLNPFIPKSSNQVLNWLDTKLERYQTNELSDVEILEFNPLYSRI
ncbi:MAG: methionine--tRNA ligase [Clostridiales bacterium]|nr:methionine--tRNA ligase [Clostridiales bacterium]